MQLINDIIYVDWADLQAWGIPEGSIKVSCSRSRNGGTSWRNIADPADKRRCLVELASIPANTQVKYGLPNLAEARTMVEKMQASSRQLVVKRLLKPVCQQDRDALLEYKVCKTSTEASTGEVLGETFQSLPIGKIELYLKQAQWLQLLGSPILKDPKVQKQLGCSCAKAAAEVVAQVAEADGANLPNNARKLSDKVKEFAAGGVIALVSGKFGNKNTQKVDSELLDLMVTLYADRRKPSIEVVHTNVVAFCHRHNKPVVSLSTVKNHLMRADIIPVWTLGRSGKAAFKNQFGYSQLTRKPTFRDALWVIDGTKVNLSYKDGSSRKSKLNMVAVVDAFSDLIIGWHIVEGQETVNEVAAAIRSALRRSKGCLPVQFLYDNDSSNTLFFKKWQGLRFPAQPYNGQSKPIEQLFGRLQSSILRQYPGFTGMNITAHGKDSRIDFDSLKVAELPTLKEALKLAETTLLQWNNTAGKDGQTPNERYNNSMNPEPEILSAQMERELFWTARPTLVEYRKQGLVLEIGGAKHWYEVYAKQEGGVLIPDLNFSLTKVGERFVVKQDPEEKVPTSVCLYELDATGQERFVAIAKAKVAVARAVADYQQDTKAQIQVGLDARRAQVMMVQDQAERAKNRVQEFMEDAIIDPWSHTKEDRNRAEHEWVERQMNAGRPAAPEPDNLVQVAIEMPQVTQETSSRAERQRLYVERMAREAMRG